MHLDEVQHQRLVESAIETGLDDLRLGNRTAFEPCEQFENVLRHTHHANLYTTVMRAVILRPSRGEFDLDQRRRANSLHGVRLNEPIAHPNGALAFQHACKLGAEGIRLTGPGVRRTG